MTDHTKIEIENLTVSHGSRTVLKRICGAFPERAITSIIGPSGAGKSTLLSTFNRLWEEDADTKATGSVRIRLDDRWWEIHDDGIDLPTLRRKVAMVFQVPNPLPVSIFRNVALPLILSGNRDKKRIRQSVLAALSAVHLKDEVEDRLDAAALHLSGGQQQRLCIARALVADPEVLLLDEPTSSLDPDAEAAIESLLLELKTRCTLILVSHSRAQVARLSDAVFRVKDGRLFPVAKTKIR